MPRQSWGKAGKGRLDVFAGHLSTPAKQQSEKGNSLASFPKGLDSPISAPTGTSHAPQVDLVQPHFQRPRSLHQLLLLPTCALHSKHRDYLALISACRYGLCTLESQAALFISQPCRFFQ